MYGTSLLYLVSIKTNFSIRWIEFLSIKINRVFFRSFLLDYSAACIFSGTRQLNYFCWILQIYRMWCPPAYKVHWLMFLGHHNYLFISTKQALSTTILLRNENGLNFRRNAFAHTAQGSLFARFDFDRNLTTFFQLFRSMKNHISSFQSSFDGKWPQCTILGRYCYNSNRIHPTFIFLHGIWKKWSRIFPWKFVDVNWFSLSEFFSIEFIEFLNVHLPRSSFISAHCEKSHILFEQMFIDFIDASDFIVLASRTLIHPWNWNEKKNSTTRIAWCNNGFTQYFFFPRHPHFAGSDEI